MNLNDVISLSRYLIITGILLDLFNLAFCAYHIHIRKSIMMKTVGFRLVFSCIIFIVIIAAIIFSIIAYQDEHLTLWFGSAGFVFSLITFIATAWTFSQLAGMQERVMALLEALVGVIEAGDQNLEGHSLHVKNLSILIYEALPLSKRLTINIFNLQYAALLLDIGKLGIPRSIIDKNGKLTKEEWDLVRRHPEIGMKVLENIDSFDTILTWIKYHHERVDGSGYYHLTKDEIPYASRILAVADTYSALTMERSYKATLSYENAISELKLVSGTQLDSDLVNIFCSIPIKNVEKCIESVQEKMKRYQIGTFR
jgi:HD-GYP domain-containing protein (c-di-GMP phosphodiesterase class II)